VVEYQIVLCRGQDCPTNFVTAMFSLMAHVGNQLNSNGSYWQPTKLLMAQVGNRLNSNGSYGQPTKL